MYAVCVPKNIYLKMHLNICLFFVLFLKFSESVPYKVCDLQNKFEACKRLEDIDIQCVRMYTGVDCLLAIENNTVDFGRISSQIGLLGANLLNNTNVIAEILDAEVKEKTRYNIVVVIRKEIEDGINGINGKRYCHPGFNSEATYYELTAFERNVIDKNGLVPKMCAANETTMLEKHIKILSEFFGPSCRPNAWYENVNLTKSFETKYPNLFNCPSKEGFEAALDCLINNGDVAVTMHSAVENFFNKPEYHQKTENFRYLCPTNTMVTLNKPCFWAKQPQDTIVVSKKKSQEIAKVLREELVKNQENARALKQSSPLASVLLLTNDDVVNIKLDVPLKAHIREFREIPNKENLNLCKKTMKWCTVSKEETKKCLWLKQASINQGILPVIECNEFLNKLECIENIEKKKIDIVDLQDYNYVVERKRLETIAYTKLAEKIQPRYVVVVNTNNNDTERIKSLNDLKGKRSCFPEYGGNACLAYLNAFRELNQENECDYGKYISEIVGDSCITGAIDKEHAQTELTDKDKLCRLCKAEGTLSKTAVNCNANEENLYYRNTLKCLQLEADFAVINLRDYEKLEENQIILCKNGTFSKNFNVDNNCALATTKESMIVTQKDNELKEDMKLALENFDNLFSQDNSPFKIFSEFGNVQNLLFNDESIEFKSLAFNYENIGKYVSDCVEEGKGSAEYRVVSPTVMYVILFFSAFMLYLY